MSPKPNSDVDSIELGATEHILSVNLYPAQEDNLDLVISSLLAPSWKELKRGMPHLHLWFSRHNNTLGEHLKLRFHGSGAGRSRILEHLKTGRCQDQLRSLMNDDQGIRKDTVSTPWQTTGSSKNREPRLIETTLEEEPAIFDDKVLLSDNIATSLLLECLVAGSDLVLQSFKADHPNLYSHRQNILLRIISLGISELLSETEEKISYLRYHRDWMIRFPVLWSGYGRSKGDQVVSMYEDQSMSLPSSSLDQLKYLLETPREEEIGNFASAQRFQQALTNLRSVLEHPARAVAVSRPDPFAESALEPAVFKVFHLLANQLGLSKIEEGLAYHLLLKATGAAETRRVALAPQIDELIGEDESRAFTPQIAAFEEGYAWEGYVLAGCQDDAWARLFREEGQFIFSVCGQALSILRQGRIRRAKRLLDEIEEQRRVLGERSLSLFEALGRFYYGTRAYYHYLVEDYDDAITLLQKAESSISRAIGIEPFLLPMAPLIFDIPLQKARVARRLRRWDEMEFYLHELRDYLEDRRPLCSLRSGEAVTHETLARYFASLDLDCKHISAVDSLLNPAQRRSEFRRRYAELYAPRSKLLPFP